MEISVHIGDQSGNQDDLADRVFEILKGYGGDSSEFSNQPEYVSLGAVVDNDAIESLTQDLRACGLAVVSKGRRLVFQPTPTIEDQA